MRVVPVFNRLIVKRDSIASDALMYDGTEVKISDGKVYSKSGIEMPGISDKDVERENSTASGVILDVGETADSQFRAGQKIAWGRYAGTVHPYKGEKYEIINDDDVLFVVEGE